jgi:hypothetical protein
MEYGSSSVSTLAHWRGEYHTPANPLSSNISANSAFYAELKK